MRDLESLCSLYELCEGDEHPLSGLGVTTPSIKAQLFEAGGDVQVASQQAFYADLENRKRMILALGSIGAALVVVGVIGYIRTRK